MLLNRQSQRQYPGRLKVFLDYLGLEGTINEQAFAKKALKNPRSSKATGKSKGNIRRNNWQLLQGRKTIL
jgi:hypothetical protein